MYRVEGKWSESVGIINAKNGHRETKFVKNPYPDKHEYMYGMTYFML